MAGPGGGGAARPPEVPRRARRRLPRRPHRRGDVGHDRRPARCDPHRGQRRSGGRRLGGPDRERRRRPLAAGAAAVPRRRPLGALALGCRGRHGARPRPLRRRPHGDGPALGGGDDRQLGADHAAATSGGRPRPLPRRAGRVAGRGAGTRRARRAGLGRRSPCARQLRPHRGLLPGDDGRSRR